MRFFLRKDIYDLKIKRQPLFRKRRDCAEKGCAARYVQDCGQLDRARPVSLLFWHVGNQAWMAWIMGDQRLSCEVLPYIGEGNV